MLNYLIAIGSILLLMMMWLLIQFSARRYAERHPEFGPYREEGKGCGSSCSCTGKCTAKKGKK